MEAMKFRVHSPEHSEAIQKRLFELGYKWQISGGNIANTRAKFIFTYNDYCITYSDSIEEFKNNKKKEATLDYLYSLTAKKKHTLKLNDEYEAKYTEGDDFVTVGCQKIPVSVIKELVKLFK